MNFCVFHTEKDIMHRHLDTFSEKNILYKLELFTEIPTQRKKGRMEVGLRSSLVDFISIELMNN